MRFAFNVETVMFVCNSGAHRPNYTVSLSRRSNMNIFLLSVAHTEKRQMTGGGANIESERFWKETVIGLIDILEGMRRTMKLLSKKHWSQDRDLKPMPPNMKQEC
jgi:hypothetical protein